MGLAIDVCVRAPFSFDKRGAINHVSLIVHNIHTFFDCSCYRKAAFAQYHFKRLPITPTLESLKSVGNVYFRWIPLKFPLHIRDYIQSRECLKFHLNLPCVHEHARHKSVEPYHGSLLCSLETPQNILLCCCSYLILPF